MLTNNIFLISSRKKSLLRGDLNLRPLRPESSALTTRPQLKSKNEYLLSTNQIFFCFCGIFSKS